MSNYDDRLEHQRRRNFSLVLGPLSGVATFSALYSGSISSWATLPFWVSTLPFVLVASTVVYWLTPVSYTHLTLPTNREV